MCARAKNLLRHGYFPDAKYELIQTGDGFYFGVFLGIEGRALRQLRKIKQKGVCFIFPGMGWEERDCPSPSPAPLAPSGRAGCSLRWDRAKGLMLLFPGL